MTSPDLVEFSMTGVVLAFVGHNLYYCNNFFLNHMLPASLCISPAHVTVGGAGRGQGSVDADVSIKRPSITPSDVSLESQLPA